MLTPQRRALMLERLARDGRLLSAALAAEFAVSEDTVRRDLRDLAAEGRLVRVHGGALPASPTHRPLADRRALQGEAKRRLAAAAAPLIRPGMVVILDGGTTHLALVEALPRDLACTVVTHAPGIAAALEGWPGVEVVVIGGRLFRHSMVACGPTAAEGFARLRADLCLLGVTGVQAETGLTTGDAEEAAIKRAMAAAAAETVVLATPDKLGAASPWGILPLDALGLLVSVAGRPAWLPAAVAHLPA
jgi:DeoR/GlpR family transcriptional regulator of sugar metabolism